MTRWILAALAAVALSGCLPESVQSVTLTPDSPEIEAALLAADARWEAAGVDPDRIIIGPGGAPVHVDPARGISSATHTIGRGHAFAGVRSMDLNGLEPAMVAHEMGHALGIKYHPDGMDEHTAPECETGAPSRPLMCAHVGKAISAEDLETACADGGCSHFTPES